MAHQLLAPAKLAAARLPRATSRPPFDPCSFSGPPPLQSNLLQGHEYYKVLDGVSEESLPQACCLPCMRGGAAATVPACTPAPTRLPCLSTHTRCAACAACLQRVMPHASKSPAAVASKIGIDQFLFAPLCTAVFYLFKVRLCWFSFSVRRNAWLLLNPWAAGV